MVSQVQDQKHSQKISPIQIQMLNLLHLNNQQLQQKLKDELLENPALDENLDNFEAEEINNATEEGDRELSLSDYKDFYGDYDDDIPTYKTNLQIDNSQSDDDYEKPIVHQEAFTDYVARQVSYLTNDASLEPVITFIIHSLDDNGYLRDSLEELKDEYEFKTMQPVTSEQFKQALAIIKKCEPIGVGAQSLQECLMMQLDRTKREEPNYKLTRKILSDYIFELENRNFVKIERALNIESETLKQSILLIAKLNPHPNSAHIQQINSNYVTPEYEVRTENGKLMVGLIKRQLPQLKLNESVLEIITDSKNKEVITKKDRSTYSYLKGKINDAKWIIDAIQQREQTMMKTIKAIAKFQYEFFITGDYKTLKPMILKNIAQIIDMDAATISRVTSTKYVQTDFGNVSLKSLFTEALLMDNGDIVSNKEIHNIIKELLSAENKRKPLTDLQISEGLRFKGYNIARRTVAKYRENLGLPIAKMRRAIN